MPSGIMASQLSQAGDIWNTAYVLDAENHRALCTVHCKDFGAWADMRFLYDVDGVYQYRDFRIPVDEIGGNSPDGIADKWQEQQRGIWESIYGPITDEEFRRVLSPRADAEPRDPDGPGGPLPEHKTEGDGLTVLQEYKGFALDGGGYYDQNGNWCGHTGGDAGLSPVYKEILIEVDRTDPYTNLPAAVLDGKPDLLFLNDVLTLASQAFSAGGELEDAGGAGIRMYWRYDDRNVTPSPMQIQGEFAVAERLASCREPDNHAYDEFIHVLFAWVRSVRLDRSDNEAFKSGGAFTYEPPDISRAGVVISVNDLYLFDSSMNTPDYPDKWGFNDLVSQDHYDINFTEFVAGLTVHEITHMLLCNPQKTYPMCWTDGRAAEHLKEDFEEARGDVMNNSLRARFARFSTPNPGTEDRCVQFVNFLEPYSTLQQLDLQGAWWRVQRP